ncbi:MAG TPA: hemerythrin domain-containing protein, partial [Bacillota bacterium]|nr:hemerythrin domain-containing protein [Bacillota bacterium]
TRGKNEMEKQLNRGIKEIIDEYPAVGRLLDDFGVGCVTCSVGTCMLKDIIAIHSLPKEQEMELMQGIEAIIDPERKSTLTDYRPAPKQAPEVKPEIKYSPPIRRLVEEHNTIKDFLALIPQLCERIRQSENLDRQLIRNCVDFIRMFADKFHHAKEEDILFTYTDRDQDIVKVMYEDHTTGRNLVKGILSALDTGDKQQIIDNFLAYQKLLSQHIKKEDEILYPWIDRNLTTTQVGELFAKFAKVDRLFGSDLRERFINFVKELKEQQA